MVWRRRLTGALAILVFTGAHAQVASKREWLSSQFSGWSGLSFYCELAGSSDKTADNLCAWATQRVRMLARQSGSQLTVVSADPFQRILDKRKVGGNHLDLVLYISTTIPKPGGVTAAYVAVKASQHVTLPPDEKSKSRNQRSGTLVMWEAHAIGSGFAGPELDGALQQAVETNLMKFLNDYADGQQ